MTTPTTPATETLTALRYWRGDTAPEVASFDGMEEPGEVEAYDAGLLGCGRDGRYYVTARGHQALRDAGF